MPDAIQPAVDTEEELPDAITVLADDFTPAAMEYHRGELGRRGYQLAGPILPRTFFRLSSDGRRREKLFDGKPQYAATFIRKPEA